MSFETQKNQTFFAGYPGISRGRPKSFRQKSLCLILVPLFWGFLAEVLLRLVPSTSRTDANFGSTSCIGVFPPPCVAKLSLGLFRKGVRVSIGVPAEGRVWGGVQVGAWEVGFSSGK